MRLLRPPIWHMAVRISMGRVPCLTWAAAIARGKRKRKRIQEHKHMHTPTYPSCDLMHDRDIAICLTGIVHDPGGAAVAATL